MELDEVLIEYLKTQRENMDMENEERKSVIMAGIESIREWTRAEDYRKIQEIYDIYMGEDHYYHIMDFNYTDCIDYFWKIIRDKRQPIAKHTLQGRGYGEYIGEEVHVHGTLDDEAMILGVNDQLQINNEKLLKETDIASFLIKPELDKIGGINRVGRAKKLLNDSRIVCIYGMSMGNTDKLWWEYIGEWLMKSSDRILIICIHDKDYKGGHIYI